jgi:hypothetical protein
MPHLPLSEFSKLRQVCPSTQMSDYRVIRRLILVGILGSQKIWLALPVWGAANVKATTDASWPQRLK